MAYFPMFIELEGERVLVVGGGRVALRKVEKLLPYGPQITVLAPRVDARLRDMPGVTVCEEPFSPKRIEGARMVIAATDDAELNHAVAELCNGARVPVNVVDDRRWCDFLFPALVKSGGLSIGISSGGASPSAAIWLRERIEELLPESLPELLAFLEEKRSGVKAAIPTEAGRTAAFREMLRLCIAKDRALTDEEYGEFMQGLADGGGEPKKERSADEKGASLEE